jgi:hypothetical protein
VKPVKRREGKGREGKVKVKERKEKEVMKAIVWCVLLALNL